MVRQEIDKIHPELYPVCNKIFNEFWELTYSPRLSEHLFSCITSENCADLGMPDYFSKVDNAVTLANIKVSHIIGF